MPTIPDSLTDLTSAWCTEALGRSTVVDSVMPLSTRSGVMGQLAIVQFAVGPPLVAKIAAEHESVREVARSYEFYTTEVSIYRHLSSTPGARLPRCHYADVSDDAKRFVLLLEDLTTAVWLDTVSGCPLPRALSVVDALAALHARWWNRPELMAATWLRPLDNRAYCAGQAIYQAVCPAFVERYAPRLPSIGLDIVRTVGDRLSELYRRTTASSPLTLAHADVRLDNILFDLPDGGELALLDWQFAVRAPGATDVATFLAQSLTIPDRRAHEGLLLRRYYDALCAHGVTRYSLDNLIFDYRLALAYMLATPVVGSSLASANGARRVLMDNIVERSVTAAVDHDVHALLNER